MPSLTVADIRDSDLDAIASDDSLTTEERGGTVESKSRDTPTIAAVRDGIVQADIEYLSAIVGELNELREGPESDEYGILRPTVYAYERTCEILIDAAIELAETGDKIPLGNTSTDEYGGVRVEWVGPKCSVYLSVPHEQGKTEYFYHEASENYATDAVSISHLAEWLRRFDAST